MSFRVNTAQGRFELDKNGVVAYADFRRDGTKLVIPYVYAPPELRGSGAASELMEGIVAQARAQNMKIVPVCGYAAVWLHRRREFHDVLAG